ncbi:hypothetical protein [Mannheimia indoligenes]|uniref:hypothetical protein n=1 Tax=Mannheimia indoligenes TaxID=3103145 RepID=UPI002FE67E90
MRKISPEPLYFVIAYQEKSDEPLLLAENLTHSNAWKVARKAMDENPDIYAISVRTMRQGGENA